ncbi:MAG: translation initiation factor eIF-2B subunit alpha [Watsoniomyces obsoletus]|nr:MAG: translation initiation factor eIF-2B subunit alpha [Watsoniomyces obsoletus]
MTSVDPSTGQPLPADAIQRVLYVAPNVHVYQIPPLTSSKGYTAAHWTADNNRWQIFTARLRVIETALADEEGKESESPKTDIVLEDPKSGDLFAAAPYTSEAVVQQALDSMRFFAIRVQDGGGRKATLGIGFEDRSEAFDFGVSLQEVRKAQTSNVGTSAPAKNKEHVTRSSKIEHKDFSLKAGETITVKLPGKGGRPQSTTKDGQSFTHDDGEGSLFAIPPPIPPPPYPGGGEDVLILAPPPPPSSAREAILEKRRSRQVDASQSAAMDAGFDDGEFGEFQ